MDRCPYTEWPQSLCTGWVILRNAQDWRAWVDHGRPPKFGSAELIYARKERGSAPTPTREATIRIDANGYTYTASDGTQATCGRLAGAAMLVEMLTHPGDQYTWQDLDSITDSADTANIKTANHTSEADQLERQTDHQAGMAAQAINDLDIDDFEEITDRTLMNMGIEKLQTLQLAIDKRGSSPSHEQASREIAALIALKQATPTTDATKLSQRVRSALHAAKKDLCATGGAGWYDAHVKPMSHGGAYSYQGNPWTVA